MTTYQTHAPKLAAIDNQLAQKYSLSRGAFVVTALLPIGKLAKAGKLGTAGTKVMQSIETGVKQFKKTVKYLEAHIGQAVKSYRWNEADLAYETKLADGSTRSVSKTELDGGSGGPVGGSGAFSFPVQPRYADETIHYPKEFPFDAQKMINDGLITKTRYDISELDTLLDDFTAKNVGHIVEGSHQKFRQQMLNIAQNYDNVKITIHKNGINALDPTEAQVFDNRTDLIDFLKDNLIN